MCLCIETGTTSSLWCLRSAPRVWCTGNCSMGLQTVATFADFIRTLPAQSHARHEYMLMDTVAFHKSKVVAAALADRQLTPLFTPHTAQSSTPLRWHFQLSSHTCANCSPSQATLQSK